MHYWGSEIGCVLTGAFIKLQSYASPAINHSGETEYLILIYSKDTLLI